MSASVDKRFARATGVLSFAMLGASGANYALNLGLARLLDRAAFGDATLIVTLLLGLTAAGVGLQLVSARLAGVATGADVAGLRAHLAGRAWRAGIVLGAVTAAAAPLLQQLFRTGSAWPFVVLAVGLPVYLVQSVDRGVLQGRLAFGRLAATFAVEALVRLVGGLALVQAGLGVTGATAALTLSFVASWLVARPATTPRPAPSPMIDTRAVATASRATVVLLVGQIVINNGDVVVAKQVLDPETAGSYAAVALVGRAVFFLSWAVANAAFPLVGDADDAPRVLRLGVTIVGAMSALAVAAIAVAGDRLGPTLFGDGLTGEAGLFVPYAAATGMFAVANLIATLDVGRDRVDSALTVLGGGILQTVLLLWSGTSPARLVDAQLMAMTVLLAATVAVHCRPRVVTTTPVPAVAATT